MSMTLDTACSVAPIWKGLLNRHSICVRRPPGSTCGMRMPQVLPGGLLTQIEWRFNKPFQIGATLQAVSSVIDIRDRLGGRYGYSVLIMTETDYIDEAGDIVASSLTTITQ